jgi:hypothetical protein
LHEIEPFYNWRHLYTAEEDENSPFYGREYSEFEYSNTIYNYYIHPQWDEFGSRTLYLKILFCDYEVGFCIIEFIGEWNDAIENDIMTLKRNVLEELIHKGISKFIFIGENILNFHYDATDYYEELIEEINELFGWMVILNLPIQTEQEWVRHPVKYYLQSMQLLNWRNYKPNDLHNDIAQKMHYLE